MININTHDSQSVTQSVDLLTLILVTKLIALSQLLFMIYFCA